MESGSGALFSSDTSQLGLVRLDLGVHVSTQVIGAGRALRLARLAVGVPRLFVGAHHVLRSSFHGHANQRTGGWAPAMHPANQGVSLLGMHKTPTRDTLEVFSGNELQPP